MIPYAILSGTYSTSYGGENTIDFRALDLSGEGFTFRLPEELPEMEKGTFYLHFFSFHEQSRKTVILAPGSYEICPEKADGLREEEEDPVQNFSFGYRVFTESEHFFECQRQLTEEYLRYISLKCQGDDSALSKTMVGYPAEKEDHYACSWEQQKRELFASLHPDPDWKRAFSKFPEIALQLDRPDMMDQYMKLPLEDFCDWYWEMQGLRDHPVSQCMPTHLYVGNQFCRHLGVCRGSMPETCRGTGSFVMLEACCGAAAYAVPEACHGAAAYAVPEACHGAAPLTLLEKAKREDLVVVLCLAPVPQDAFEETKEYLRALSKKTDLCGEIVVNDLGILRFLQKELPGVFRVTAGSLLVKMKKDVRMSWKTSGEQLIENGEKNGFYSDFFRPYLKEELGIKGLLLESAGASVTPVPAMDCGVLFPFYQMNTAGNCTMYAVCHNGARGKQEYVASCPHYCLKEHFLYPSFLRMVGSYNSLFGFDPLLLESSAELNRLYDAGIRRLILQLV